MKKVLVAVAMILGMGTSVAFAQEVKDSTVIETPQVIPVEYTEMDAEKLPQEVINALAKDNEGATIKKSFVAEKTEGKVFKVIIVTKEAQEVTTFLNNKGETVKE